MRGRIVAQLMLAVGVAGCGGLLSPTYTSTEGRYRVQFAGTPKLMDKMVPTPVGPVTARFAISEERSGTARMVMYVDYPPNLFRADNVEQALDSGCQGMLEQSQSVAQSTRHIAMNGHPGREVDFESRPDRPGGKLTGRARLYAVGNRLYNISIAGRAGVLQPDTMASFISSFELVGEPPPPAGPMMAGGPPMGPPGSNPQPMGPQGFNPRPMGPQGFNPRPMGPQGPVPPQFQQRPGVRPNGRPGHFPAPNVRPPRGPAPAQPFYPNRTPAPAPTPTPASGEVLAFYNIPEPASTTIEADLSANDSTSPIASAGGVSIRSFTWVDENADLVGGYGNAAEADGIKDQHFRLVLELPANAVIESIAITSGEAHHWVTQPSDRYWPIAVFRGGRPISRSHVEQVGAFSGPSDLDLYFNTGIGIGPGSPFDLELVLTTDGRRISLTSHCKRPELPTGPLAHALPAPDSPPAAPEQVPALQPAQEPPPSVRHGDDNEVPPVVYPSSGGATIVSFDWLDRDDDYVSSDGRRIAPGGGKDEHYRLVMDLPPASIVEEIAIVGGGVLHWTTRPSTKYWPVAVVVNQELKNRGQSLRLGAFSGRWNFDLYAESHGTVRPGQAFGVEVVVYVRGTRHRLTASCHRK